jgi:THO complex subunit 5
MTGDNATTGNDIVADPNLAHVLQVSSDAYNQAMELLTKLEEAIQNGDGSLSADEQTELLRQQKLMYSNIAHLRGLHRAANLNVRETKTVTADARLEVDRLHLQLQNLYYEQRHLEGEIAACESYEYVGQNMGQNICNSKWSQTS